MRKINKTTRILTVTSQLLGSHCFLLEAKKQSNCGYECPFTYAAGSYVDTLIPLSPIFSNLLSIYCKTRLKTPWTIVIKLITIIRRYLYPVVSAQQNNNITTYLDKTIILNNQCRQNGGSRLFEALNISTNECVHVTTAS